MMVRLFRILLDTESSLVLSYTSLLPVQTSLRQFRYSVSSCMLPLPHTMQRCSEFSDTSAALSPGPCSIVQTHLRLFELTLMLAGQMILILVARPQGIASFWALLSYLGGARDKKLSLDPALKL